MLVIVVYLVKQTEHTNTVCEENSLFNCENGDKYALKG
jgi:hypothetical protein